ncbi:hypothetical protein SSX86_010230 [Deinandra increscens subsp. villosa]|uniref:Wall-associated receptor kinase galacturonan-binding domain-containing protein n=1 Tax=Deinandra increscens subsp. villosa TaxID=3103831 RepID=A0AAP0DER9_9ASTR
MILQLLLFSLILISPSTSAQKNCNRVCRGGGGLETSVSYPFGFSDGFEIRLDCSAAGEIRVGEYNVRNMSRDRLLIDFPGKCGRAYDEIHVFNNTNFAITSRNGFLLENCGRRLINCRVEIRSTSIDVLVQGLINL